MPIPVATPSSIEALQEQNLKQLLDYQKALKTLLGALPEAGKTLLDLLDSQVQQSFLKHPLPIALDAVSYEESILLALHSGSTLIDWPRPATPNLMIHLFNNKPWGGKNFKAPNRVYRYVTKTIYDEVTPSAPRRKRTVHLTTTSTPAFEQFVEDLLRHPHRYYQQQLDNFWRSAFSPGKPLTRQCWLTDQLGKAVITEASLRVADQTLDTAGKVLIDQIVNQPTHQTRTHLPSQQRPATFAVSLKGQNQQADIPLVGVFIVSSQTPNAGIDAQTELGAVVLFTPDKGLDLFTSLQALDQVLRTRFIAAKAEPATGLLGTVSWQEQARAQGYQTTVVPFAYTQIQGNIFEHCVQSLLTLQKQDIAHGWDPLPRHEPSAENVYELFNRLAHIGPLLDIRQRLVDRGRRYIQTNLPSWYQAASAQDQQALDTRIEAELVSNQTFARLFNEADIPTLAIFARSELIRQLSIDYPAKAIDPDRVQVSITHSLNPASLGGGIGPDHVPYPDDPATRPSQTQVLTLTALALRNIDPWDFSFYKLFTGQKTSLSARYQAPTGTLIEFDESYLKSLVQRLDVSTGYDQLLQARLITDGLALRKAWTDAHRASLACATLAAQLDTSSLLQGYPRRGHLWLQAIVEADTLASRKTVDGHKVIASSLLIANSASTRNGYPLNDVLIISLEQRRPIPNVILYTPGAPNEHTFKEFADLEAMQQFLMQQWAESPDWRRYTLQRLSKAAQAALTEQPGLLGELIFNARSRVGNPFQTLHTFAINGPLHDELYAQRVCTLRQNADHDSTDNREVEEQSLWNKILFGRELALDLVLLLPIATASKTLHSVAKAFLLLKQAGTSKTTARALWSITGARHLPPQPPLLRGLPALRPSPDLTGMHVQMRPADLERIKGNLYQSKTGAQHYALINGKYYLSNVAQGQRFIYSPSTALQSLRYPLIKHRDRDTWHAGSLPRLRGGMDPIEKGPFDTSHQDYELPLADRASLPAINVAFPGTYTLGVLIPTLPQSTSTSMLHLFAIQARLRRHAGIFFKSFREPTGPLVIPPRNLAPEPLFSHLLNQRNGLVIGEGHEDSLTRKLLIENMPALKRLSLDRLYIEFFNSDLHQTPLDTFNTSPAMPMPQLIRERLRWLDTHFRLSHNYNYTQLVEAAHAQGIKVMALDSTACAQLKTGDLSPPGAAQTLSDQLDRVTMFNFFAHKKIAADHRAHGPRRWLALVGLAHCSTFQGIPGLANLTGATSVRVASRLATLPMRITRDPGVIVPSLLGTHPLEARCELLMHAPTLGSNFTLFTRVHSPALFTLTYAPPGNVFIHYMNAQHQHFDIPVLVDGSRPYVDHAPLGAVSNRRFNCFDDLVDALTDELMMVEV